MKRFQILTCIGLLCCVMLPLAAKTTVFCIGDSTMATKTENDNPLERGWGQMLQLYFDSDYVVVDNHAKNGRSTKSFIDQGLWQAVYDKIQPGDYVFIQFGHNDEKSEATAAHTGYRDYLIRYVREVREKGGKPVLLTPIVRRRFDEKGEFYDSHGEYPDVVRALAKELKVPLIDMQAKTEKLLRTMGEEDSKKIFLFVAPGVLTRYPNGVEDNTHLCDFGAIRIAGLAVDGIRSAKLPIRKYLKPGMLKID